MYRIKTYETVTSGFAARIEWISTPGKKSFPGDIKFGFNSLRTARSWANDRKKELTLIAKDLHY